MFSLDKLHCILFFIFIDNGAKISSLDKKIIWKFSPWPIQTMHGKGNLLSDLWPSNMVTITIIRNVIKYMNNLNCSIFPLDTVYLKFADCVDYTNWAYLYKICSAKWKYSDRFKPNFAVLVLVISPLEKTFIFHSS